MDDSFVRINQAREDILDTSLATNVTDAASVAMYLAKPIAVFTGTVTSADALGSVKASFNIATQLVSVTNKVWYYKIAGYNMMRGTAVVRVVINAQPFQQGRLLLHCLPNALGYANYSTTYESNHNLNLTQQTTHPCVELDIHDSAAELRVPFVSPTMWYSRDQPYGWGKIYLRILSPLLSAAANSFSYTIFLSFDDFELCAPIFGPEMGKKRPRLNVALSSVVRESNVISEKGPISSTLSAITSAANALVNVPLIGGVASAVSTVSGILGSAASWLGWSKPNYSGADSVVAIRSIPRGCNSNGANFGDVLSLDSMNSLPQLDGFAGSHDDEMSFAYLKKIPAYFTTVTLSTSDVAGTSVYDQYIGPRAILSAYSFVNGAIVNTAYTSAPFVFLARYFMYWRGSIEITIKFCKTQFHTGKYAFTFIPTYTAGAQPTNLLQQTYVYREIIDIREHSEVTIKLPYLLPCNYLETAMINTVNSQVNANSGQFHIVPINPLVATTTVSTTIQALIYFNAGDDFELAGAVTNYNCPAVVAQIGDDSILQATKPIGGSPDPAITMLPVMSSIGEHFSSVKQLINCLRPVSSDMTYWSTSIAVGRTADWYPFANQLPLISDVTSNTIVPQDFGGDVLSELVSGFVLSRGGIRYAIPFPSTGGLTPASIFATLIYATSTVWNTIANGVSSPNPIVGGPLNTLNVSNVDHGITMAGTAFYCTLDVTVPHMMRTPSRLNYISADNLGGNAVVKPSAISPGNNLFADSMSAHVKVIMSGIGAGTRLYRSGADDLALGYFIGFFPFVLS